jgi:FkbM family methyltransferase
MNAFRFCLHQAKRLAFAFRLQRGGAFRYFGTRVHFPRRSHLVRRAVGEGIYEKVALDLLSSSARAGTTVFDVGANIGLISVPILSRCPRVRVVSFEPVPRVFACLARTHRECPYRDRWELRPLGLSDRPGRQEFFLPAAGQDAFASLVRTGRTVVRDVIAIDCATLDDEWSRLDRPPTSVIKIDVEGAELKVLAGAKRCLEACRPLILIEWNATNLAAAAEDPAGLLSFCASAGYRLHPVPGWFEIRSPEVLAAVMRELDSFLLLPT